MNRCLIGGSLIALLGTGCSGAKPAAETVVDGRAIASEDQGGNWLSVGPTYAEQHYSPLTAITVENVKDLGLAWSLDLLGQRGLQATPLAVDGILYFSGTSGWVFAVDARRGTLLWKFDPDLTHNPPQRDGVIYSSNRGV